MISVLIDGVTPPSDDGWLLRALRDAAARDPLFGPCVLIGLRNDEGEVYRLVQCHGRKQTGRITERIRVLGFREQSFMGSQYHYLFGR